MICDNCGEMAITQMHHKMSQSKLNKRLYPEFIHHQDNIQMLCAPCHLNKPVLKWSEREFCSHFGIKPRSKVGKFSTQMRDEFI